jgi:hypothetical protein
MKWSVSIPDGIGQVCHLGGVLGNIRVVKAEHAEEMVEHGTTHLFHVAKEEIVLWYDNKVTQQPLGQLGARMGLWTAGE